MKSDHGQNAKETVTSSVSKIIKDPDLFRLRYLIIFSVAISFITFFYTSVLFSCQISLFQNAVMIYLAILMLFSTSKITDRLERIKLGVPIAIILGIFIAGISMLIDTIQYYFFGFRERVFSAIGVVAPQATIQTFLAGLSSQIVLFLILISISAFAGYLASITSLRKNTQ